jgi:hypothetical protein
MHAVRANCPRHPSDSAGQLRLLRPVDRRLRPSHMHPDCGSHHANPYTTLRKQSAGRGLANRSSHGERHTNSASRPHEHRSKRTRPAPTMTAFPGLGAPRLTTAHASLSGPSWDGNSFPIHAGETSSRMRKILGVKECTSAPPRTRAPQPARTVRTGRPEPVGCTVVKET